MTNNNTNDIRTKVQKGIELTFNQLLEAKLKDNSDVVISHNGKVIRIKALDLIQHLKTETR